MDAIRTVVEVLIEKVDVHGPIRFYERFAGQKFVTNPHNLKPVS